jgi:hypothetical protein
MMAPLVVQVLLATIALQEQQVRQVHLAPTLLVTSSPVLQVLQGNVEKVARAVRVVVVVLEKAVYFALMVPGPLAPVVAVAAKVAREVLEEPVAADLFASTCFQMELVE